MATWFQAVPPPWKRMARRSTDLLGIEGRRAVHLAAEAELRVVLGATMPDLASRREASTSCVLLPMDETMPIPVTTTRLIARSSWPISAVADDVRPARA